MLSGLITRLQRMNRFSIVPDEAWIRVYSFDPKDEDTINKCNIRFYFNVKFEHILTLLELIVFYIDMSQKKRVYLSECYETLKKQTMFI